MDIIFNLGICISRLEIELELGQYVASGPIIIKEQNYRSSLGEMGVTNYIQRETIFFH